MKPTIKAIAALLKELKKQIGDEYRATDDPSDTLPGIQVTISTDDDFNHWRYQTGDNSYTGACYHDPHWAVIYLYRRSDTRSLAREAIEELKELAWEARETIKEFERTAQKV